MTASSSSTNEGRRMAELSKLIAGCMLLAAGPAVAELPDREFVQYVDARIASGEYVGVIAAVIDGDDTFVQAFGATKKGLDLPPDERTMFEISSISKTFTAAALALSVTEGRVKLDDPANRYLEPRASLASFEDRNASETATLTFR